MHSEWSQAKAQFRTLYRVFLLRVVDLELLSAGGDPARLIRQFVTIFTTVSFFLILPALVFLVFGGGMPMTAKWMYEHFLIETTMTVAGLVALLNWDAAFPDKRDILILGPLPVRTSTLFLAKVAALLVAPGLAAIALNIFVGVLWPLFFRSSGAGFLGEIASMACVLDHDPSGQRIFCLHHPCPSRAGGQSVAAAVFPPSIGIFAGRRHEPFGERIFSRAIARIARGAHFATKSAAAGVSSLLLVPGYL